MAKANLKAVPAEQPNPYDGNDNPLIESSLLDSLCNMQGYAHFLYIAACDDTNECAEIQHGRTIALRVLTNALDRMEEIEAAQAKGGRS